MTTGGTILPLPVGRVAAQSSGVRVHLSWDESKERENALDLRATQDHGEGFESIKSDVTEFSTAGEIVRAQRAALS